MLRESQRNAYVQGILPPTSRIFLILFTLTAFTYVDIHPDPPRLSSTSCLFNIYTRIGHRTRADNRAAVIIDTPSITGYHPTRVRAGYPCHPEAASILRENLTQSDTRGVPDGMDTRADAPSAIVRSMCIL